MPRDKHPSDEKRSRPYIRIHLTRRGHPKYGRVFADPLYRGVIDGLWEVAAINFAAKTNEEVTLHRHDLAYITGRSQFDSQVKLLRTVCNLMAYSMQVGADFIVIKVRNFARKQKFAIPTCAELADGEDAEVGGVLHLRDSDTPIHRNTESPNPVTDAPQGELIAAEKPKSLQQWYRDDLVPAFPKHRQVQLKTGWTEIQKLNPNADLRVKIVAGVTEWAASHEWTREEGRFAKGVATFLADRMYEKKPMPHLSAVRSTEGAGGKPVRARRGDFGIRAIPGWQPNGATQT